MDSGVLTGTLPFEVQIDDEQHFEILSCAVSRVDPVAGKRLSGGSRFVPPGITGELRDVLAELAHPTRHDRVHDRTDDESTEGCSAGCHQDKGEIVQSGLLVVGCARSYQILTVMSIVQRVHIS